MRRYTLRPPTTEDLRCGARWLFLIAAGHPAPFERDPDRTPLEVAREHLARIALTPAWRTRDRLREPLWPPQTPDTIHVWAAIGASDALSGNKKQVTPDPTGPHALAYTMAHEAVFGAYMDTPEVTPKPAQDAWQPPAHPPMLGPWRTSSHCIPLLDEAMCIAQELIEAAPKSSSNEFFDSKYAGLESVMAIVKPACTAARIARYQPAWTDDDPGVVVTTRLACKGEWCEADLRVPVDKTNAQALGSAVTYGRRFGISSMLGVPTADDDGNAAAAAPPARQTSGTKKADAIGARCSGAKWPGDLGREIDQLVQDLSTLDGSDPGSVWWPLIEDAGVNQQPYMDTDGEWPGQARVLSTADGKMVKAEALKKIADARQT